MKNRVKWLKYGKMDMLRRKVKQLSQFKTTGDAKKLTIKDDIFNYSNAYSFGSTYMKKVFNLWGRKKV